MGLWLKRPANFSPSLQEGDPNMALPNPHHCP